MSGRGDQGSGVGDPGVVPKGGEARGPTWTLLAASCQCPTEAPFAHAAAETPADPARPADPGPPARASEGGPDLHLAFLQKNGRLSRSWSGAVVGQSLSKHAAGAAGRSREQCRPAP